MHPASPLRRRFDARAALLAAALLAPAPLLAGGMALTMQNGSQLGSAFTGGAAAEDASTLYYNPAGLAFLEHGEVVAAASYVMLESRFRNDGSTTAGMLPTAGSNGGDAGVDTLIPVAYMAYPVSRTVTVGVGVSAPYGLATEYAAGWVGRYHALKSELVTINTSLGVAWRPTSRLSLGLALDRQKADATLTNAIDVGLLGALSQIPGFAPGSADAHVRIRGSDTRTGFNVGAIYEIMSGTRVGMHYRSKMAHRLTGRARFTDVAAPFTAVLADQRVRAPLTLPEILSLSFAHALTPDLSVFADWSLWKWNRFRSLDVDFESPATPDVVQPQNWDNAAIYSAGVRWQRGDKLTLRAGLAFNETPVPDAARRTARIPDSDRTWLCLGAGWQFNAEIRGEFSVAHLFMDDARIASDDGAGHLLAGTYQASANIVSAQLNWVF